MMGTPRSALIAALLVSCATAANAAPPTQIIVVEAFRADPPAFVFLAPLTIGVDLGTPFHSIEDVVVHAQFVEDLLDPGETFFVFFEGPTGQNIGMGISNRSSEPLDRVSVNVSGIAPPQLMNGLSPFRVETSVGPVLLGSVRVEVLGRPVPDAEEIVGCIDQAADEARLSGVGPSQSASNHFEAFRRKVVQAGELLNEGDLRRGCDRLTEAALRIDGTSPPRDFVEGEAAPEIFSLLNSLRLALSCDAVIWSFRAEVTDRLGQGSPFAIGQVWEGRLAFEPATPDSDPLDHSGHYRESIAAARLWFEDTEITLLPQDREGTLIGVRTQPLFAFDLLRIGMSDIPAEVTGPSGTTSLRATRMSFSFDDRDGTVFDDDSLPLAPPPIDEWETRGLALEIDFGEGRVRTTLLVTSLDVGKRF